jgi:hypothetical protein
VTAMTHSADACRALTRRLGRDGPVPGTGAEVAADRSTAVPARARTVRSWPLLVLAAPAAAEVWSGWVEAGQIEVLADERSRFVKASLSGDHELIYPPIEEFWDAAVKSTG